MPHALLRLGHVYVCDANNGTVWKYTLASGALTTVGALGSFPGAGTVALDAAGNVFVGAWGTITKVSPAGQATTLAKSIYFLNGLAVDGAGDVYVAAGGGGFYGIPDQVTVAKLVASA